MADGSYFGEGVLWAITPIFNKNYKYIILLFIYNIYIIYK